MSISKFVLATLVVTIGLNESLSACPFCSQVAQTLSEEMQSMDAVVIAELSQKPPETSPDSNEIPRAKFVIKKIIRGKGAIKQTEIEALYFGDGEKGDSFLITALDSSELQWTTPLKLTPVGVDYVTKILDLPKGSERLKFFQNHLEDSNELLARDAYDEFAKAPYEQIIELKSELDRDQLIAWIQDPAVPASRRRLYFTMLGVCGSAEDLPMLESLLRSSDRKSKSGLDALVACYLTLHGEKGLSLVENLFLKDTSAEYADTYQTIMALRFHASETDAVPRERLLGSFRLMLERPRLADLVIPDLARWEDWSQIDKLVELFKAADEKSSWVRVPVINYLRVCPLPEAAKHLKVLEKIDPAAMKRARIFHLGVPADGSSDEKTSSVAPKDSRRQLSRQVAVASTAPQRVPTEEFAPNKFTLAAVPIVLASALLLTMWTLLRGSTATPRR
ncbi:MAG: hypothetical protein ACI9G1_002907 [Pirellulaceae bacterium]|jgi:hypothetical protein